MYYLAKEIVFTLFILIIVDLDFLFHDSSNLIQRGAAAILDHVNL